MGKYFGISGIREVFNEKLIFELVLKVGKVFGMYFGGGKVVIGKDIRISGDVIKLVVISGFFLIGVDVIDIGLVLMLFMGFVIKFYGVDVGVIIIVFYNLLEYNGIKVW